MLNLAPFTWLCHFWSMLIIDEVKLWMLIVHNFNSKLKQTIPTLRKELQRRKGGGDHNQQQQKRNSKVPSKEKTTSRQEKKKASSSSSSKQNVAEAQAATASSPPKESTMTLKSLLGVTDQSPTSSSVSSKSSGAEKLHKAVEPSKQPDALAQLFATSGVKSSTFAAATPKTAHRASLVEEMLKSRGVSPRATNHVGCVT